MAAYTFSSAHGMSFRIDHIRPQNKFQNINKIESKAGIFSNHSSMKLQIN